MGALVALEAAAARSASASRGSALVGAAAKMPVHPDLLAAAEANIHDAIDMVASGASAPPARSAAAETPGLWMLGGAERLLEPPRPACLHADLAACNAYRGAA